MMNGSMKPDQNLHRYIAYRLATDGRPSNTAGGCGPMALLFVFAAIVIVVFAIAR